MNTLKKDLTARFGTGKSYARGETSVLKAGTEIGRRWQKNGQEFFDALEYGHWTAYCVKTAAELNAALEGG